MLDDYVASIDLDGIKDGLSSIASGAKTNAKWLGREILDLGGQASEKLWELGKYLVTVVQSIWEEAKPALANIFQFLSSPMGVTLLFTFSAVVLGNMALNKVGEQSKTARYALGLLSLFAMATATAYGCQLGVIPVVFK